MADVLGVGKAVEKLLDPVGDLIKKIAGPAAEEIGLTLQDSIKVYRAKRQYKLFEKMREFVTEGGYEPRHIPLKVLLPSMEYASVEEDEDLHTAWAALLATAAHPGNDSVPVSFVEILRQLSPRDARFIWAICEEAVRHWLPVQGRSGALLELVREHRFYKFSLFTVWANLGFSATGSRPLTIAERHSELAEQRRRDELDFRMSLDNLSRLGLVETSTEIEIPVPQSKDIQEAEQFSGRKLNHETENLFRINTLGYEFVCACTQPSERKKRKANPG